MFMGLEEGSQLGTHGYRATLVSRTAIRQRCPNIQKNAIGYKFETYAIYHNLLAIYYNLLAIYNLLVYIYGTWHV